LQKTPVNNRLIELSNGKTNTFKLSQSLNDTPNKTNTTNTTNNTTNVIIKAKKDKTSNIYNNQLNRSIKTSLNEQEKKNYRTSIKNYLNELKSTNQQHSQKIMQNEPISETKSTRAITVKLFASNQFKMNLPPINKYKLFNNFDKKIGANRVGVVVGGPIFVAAGENPSNTKRLIKPSTTPNSVSRILVNRSMANNSTISGGGGYREKRTVSSSGRLVLKKNSQSVKNINSSRLEMSGGFGDSTND
jgi:hypothetical protein